MPWHWLASTYSLRNVGEVLGWTNRVPIAIDSMEEGRMGPRRNVWPQEGGRWASSKVYRVPGRRARWTHVYVPSNTTPQNWLPD